MNENLFNVKIIDLNSTT